MSELAIRALNGVAETLLMPLYVRARESQRSDAFNALIRRPASSALSSVGQRC